MPLSKCAPPLPKFLAVPMTKNTTVNSQAGDNYWFLATVETLSFLP